jgi:hypothetical protein
MGYKYGKSNPRNYPSALSNRQAYAIWRDDNADFSRAAHSQAVEEKAKLDKAMNALGITGKVGKICIGLNRAKITVDGKPFGIFDFDRETFVD